MDNLKGMHRFLKKFIHPRLNKEETEIRNNSHICTETDTVINSLPKTKIPGSDDFTAEFYQTDREELMYILLKLFQKNCRGRNTSKFIL